MLAFGLVMFAIGALLANVATALAFAGIALVLVAPHSAGASARTLRSTDGLAAR